ncbi:MULTISPECIES: aminotransferase class IV [Staphylococcus]|uniref:aminotransferase class IV n=1 Tax=Staphylococcus TaxID=1279 RepID=UPI0015E5ED31|nr:MULTISPECIES: aminotransferase class IV [Staphylococcus]MBA1354723.1 aminodeoxychorismate lyase [Staphylococcus cohnii]MBA1390751.1 aminodeoxychorismate lyase [Staphylococcus cohnii]
MQLFETLRLDSGNFSRLTYHYDRIKHSANQFQMTFEDEQWNKTISEIKGLYFTGTYRVKIILHPNGIFKYEVAELPQKDSFTAKIVPLTPIQDKRVLTNKTTNRDHLAHNHETDLILLYDKSGKILEFDIGNIMIKEGNYYYTPVYNEDFLKGCKRQELIEEGKLIEKDYSLTDFKHKLRQNQIQVFLINSLREVADVAINL